MCPVTEGAPFSPILWGKPSATFGKKKWPGQVRSRSYDVIRGTTSGNLTTEVVFTATWRRDIDVNDNIWT